jgi:hypothetical protein
LAAVLGNAMNKLSDNGSPISKDRAIEAGRYAVFTRKIKYLYQPEWLREGNAMSQYSPSRKSELMVRLHAQTQPSKANQNPMANKKCRFL